MVSRPLVRILMLSVAALSGSLTGCGLADTTVGAAAGAASEAEQARQAKQTEAQVKNQVESIQQQNAAQRDQTEQGAQ